MVPCSTGFRKGTTLNFKRGHSRRKASKGASTKYEKGTNRVSAGRLQRIADMLNTPVMFFYGGMGAKPKKKGEHNSSLAFVQTKGAMRLLRAYAEIGSRTTKYALVVLAESLRNKDRTK